jgi:hypothetical protein
LLDKIETDGWHEKKEIRNHRTRRGYRGRRKEEDFFIPFGEFGLAGGIGGDLLHSSSILPVAKPPWFFHCIFYTRTKVEKTETKSRFPRLHPFASNSQYGLAALFSWPIHLFFLCKKKSYHKLDPIHMKRILRIPQRNIILKSIGICLPFFSCPFLNANLVYPVRKLTIRYEFTQPVV